MTRTKGSKVIGRYDTKTSENAEMLELKSSAQDQNCAQIIERKNLGYGKRKW